MYTYCNPLDIGYRYQHHTGDVLCGVREGADPTLVYFKDHYYLFVSMSAGFWHSVDLLGWEFHPDPDLMIYDYAPDVRQIGDYLYFCASRRNRKCPILRTSDPLNEKFEEISQPFPFWDPNLFCDEDGRVYLYWGCTNTEPIYGIEMDPNTMLPIGEKKALVYGREMEHGFERPGENGVIDNEKSAVYQQLSKLYNLVTGKIELPGGKQKSGEDTVEDLTKMFLNINRPYIEGAFMTKWQGKYYLQYACPGTEYNIYSDGVYVGDDPLGPFVLQKSNPFSSKPGGFITGAGHGSTIQDRYGNFWHASSMRISRGHSFERRIGLFPAGFDEAGVLYCNQNFADYPHRIPQEKFDARSQQPEWMLLSYRKKVSASSTAPESDPSLSVNEDIRTWWSAGNAGEGEWICVDLEDLCDIRAIQVNLADDHLQVDFPPESYGDERRSRHIELEPQISHYNIAVSSDGDKWTTVCMTARECSNGYYEYIKGIQARYVKVTGGKLPYGQTLRISGLRVFGNGSGQKPLQVKAAAIRTGAMNAKVTWDKIAGAQGYNVRYGISPNKLYMSWLVYDSTEVDLSTLIKGQDYYVCVDSFNENGITEGEVIHLKERE